MIEWWYKRRARRLCDRMVSLAARYPELRGWAYVDLAALAMECLGGRPDEIEHVRRHFDDRAAAPRLRRVTSP